MDSRDRCPVCGDEDHHGCDPARLKRYRVVLCATCSHPGGQHIIDAGCRLCDCPEWNEGLQGWWSDRNTEDALARHLHEAAHFGGDQNNP